MKLSAFHKSLGDTIELKKLGLRFYNRNKSKRIVDGSSFNRVYVSIIFTTNKDMVEVINCDDIVFGGTGHDIIEKLPSNIDDFEEDYSIYPDNKISYGFMTRGCIRKCSFCFVPQKEGSLCFYRDWRKIKKHDIIYFLDNNFLAYPKHKEILEDLYNNKIKFQFNQGLDIRLIDDENASLFKKCKYDGTIFFSFDNILDINIIEKKVLILKKYFTKKWSIRMFIFCHPNMDTINDVVFRAKWCVEHGISPYIMRDISCYTDKNSDFYNDLAGYYNQPRIMCSMSFVDYMIRKTETTNDIDRAYNSLTLYELYQPPQNINT